MHRRPALSADPRQPPAERLVARPRWYGDPTYSTGGDARDAKADEHPDAGDWDRPERHRALLLQLDANYDGWAIATAHDGLPVYGELPRGARVAIWHKTNSPGTANRIQNCWEPVIVRPPASRISSLRMGGQVPDLFTAAAPRLGFAGAKPPAWTRWVLDMLGYDAETDTVDDLFPGSGAVSAELRQGVIL